MLLAFVLSSMPRLLAVLSSILIFLPLSAWAQWEMLEDIQEQGLDFSTANESGIRIDPELQTISLTGGAKVDHQGVKLHADEMVLQGSSQDIFLTGDVRVYRDDLVFRGDSAIYNYGSGKLTANELRSGQEPILFSTEEFRTQLDTETKSADFLEADSVYLTTHDNETPNYHLEASRVTIYPPPANRIEMHDVKVVVGNRTVFWFPYFAQSLNEELGWYFSPGFNSTWGGYLQSEYGVMWEDHTLVKYQLDLRTKRGVAFGLELESQKHKKNDNFGLMKLYYGHDLAPETSNTTRQRRDLNPDRYRFSLQHRVYVPGPEESSLYVDIDVNKLSDEFVYEDFFPSVFKIDPNPENLINIVKTHPRGTVSALARMDLNDFFRSDQRLPEIALDATRQSVLGTSLFYEGETSIGAYREPLSSLENDFLRGLGGDFEDFFGVSASTVDPQGLRTILDDLRDQVDGYSFKRFDTFHQLSYPIAFGNGASLVPRVGLRNTSYFDIDSGNPDIDSSESRTLVHAGFEGSLKFSREYPNMLSKWWGLNGARHIVQPYFNYSYLGGADLSGTVPRIDRLTPSTSLRPIDLGRFTAIDDINPWNIMRFGVRNVLQTKRDGRSHNWLQLNTYMDTYLEDPEFDRDYSNLFNELTWHPLPWLKMEVDTQVPLFNNDQDFIEVNSRLRFMPTNRTEVILGHRFLNDHPFFGDSNLLNMRFYTRINENWGFGMYHRYEMDDNTLELQQYSVHRDLGAWTAAVGAIARDNRGGDEYGLVFALTMKDLPRVRLPLSIDPNPAGR